MHAHDESQQRAELRLAFLRHLPKRAEAIARRGRRYCRDGWDINALSLLHEDVQRLAGASGRYGVLEVSEPLLALEQVLDPFLDRQSLPDEAANSQVLELLEALAPALEEPAAEVAATAGQPASGSRDSPRFELAPARYWRRWSADAPAPRFAEAPTAARRTQQPAAVPSPEAAPAAPARNKARAKPKAVPAKAVAPAMPVPAPAQALRIYHLTDSSEIALALDQRLETLGYELELLDSAEELREVLGALAPDALIVGAAFQDELEEIGKVLRQTRQRIGSPLPLLVLAAEDSMPTRLAARRAGADALMIGPSSPDQVIDRLRELMDPEREAPFRVMIVEDDRSQAMFAESILRNAGMEPLVVDDAFRVLEVMAGFRPDLVLMDLYMPGCDGTELTALIREREEFLHTPIVFLSGESDQDKHFEALDAGGDDFLAKPIRPKHLIAAVNNRVRRARAVIRRSERSDPRDPGTGLYDRGHVLDRINDALGSDSVRDSEGGVLFLEIDGAAQLRERLGISSVEQVLAQVAQLVVEQAPKDALATRYGDGGFLLACAGLDEAGLDQLAVALRGAIAGQAFSAQDRPLRLRASIGLAAYRHGFGDATALLNVVERATREARGKDSGTHRFEPPRRADREREAALVQQIADAVDNDALELLFQPIVALQGGDQAQYQTLLRMRDESGELHSAGAIVPLAERADMVLDIDRWVVTHAMQVIEQRRGEHRPVRLFVNQSVQSLADPGYGDWLRTQIEARKLPSGTLIIEIAADAAGSQLPAVKQFCATLVPSGVQFCLSRFEHSGYTVALRAELPVDFVKLAPRYLDASSSPGVRDELRTLIDDAHGAGLEVIAPLVEDAQSASTLWLTGIDFIQGNLVQQAARTLDFDFQAAVL